MSSFARHQNGGCIDGISVKEYDDSATANTFPQTQSDCYDAGKEFGEPDILPRIGDEYQAELPPLIRKPIHMPYTETGLHSLQDFFMGLSIPLIWIDLGKSDGPQTVQGSRHPSHKNVIEVGTLCNGDSEPSHNSVKGVVKSLPVVVNIPMCIDEGHRLVPGLPSERWNDAEKASFLLALYLFDKNFVEVRRFVGSKGMGAILLFYYGEFYGSDAYRRWSEGQKSKSKKCVYGQRIFSGSRQQEFLSRLLSRVSEECKSALLEVSRTFAEDKISLVDYVSTLKDTVGMDLIVKAVAIGSGKQDLTGMALESVRSNHVTRSEIPAGKACSALTTDEINKFLSGDYRLSKARSNDLFWEAVWPRLLARGWHSEQPDNQGYAAGSKCLVFLLPGVKKFSRRKLVKGDHYFDSVTDVLSKVSKDPGLIELESDEANGYQDMKNDEPTDDAKMIEDENHLPSRQRHSYLQPRTPNRSADAIKFTVVDTGLPVGKIRELRTLPQEIPSNMISLDAAEEKKMAEPDPTGKSGPKKLASRKNRDDNGSRLDIHPNVGKPSAPPKRKDLNDNQKPRKVSKPVPSRKQKQGDADNVAPISKRCKKLSSNTHEEPRDGVLLHPHSTTTVPRFEKGVSFSSSGVHESTGTTQVSSLQDKLSPSRSSRGSQKESTGYPEPQLLIDLNLPHVPLEIENNYFAPNLPNEPDIQPVQLHILGLAAPSPVEASSEQQSVVNTRRLSTRYRPPTTRALEAVAGGYLSVSRRKKGRDTSSLDAQPPRSSQQPRSRPGPRESPISSMASPSQIAEAHRGASTSGTSNTYKKNYDPPQPNQDKPAPRQQQQQQQQQSELINKKGIV
ncbi:uncharacterized protein LOC121766368 [Salvia splendens]|uniref:uncharacterized protein LOC121766368 n=1 Tax=Salvia splendens TaxID=180675 RepID=UPI0010FFDB69|nr:uncharacterized protein LOC121766368 [Salvia splendens]XP_042018581.1 uncharacterized protein LOC121766368 [Salvia splendens]XP_042018582.1 uncharacterized protein LOC121766368 [Salvia splendens]XP_042018584.1 uncharacterized protein LOC121766368 [Salvia splendens]